MKTIERLIADLTPYQAIQEIPASVLNEAIMTMQALLDLLAEGKYLSAEVKNDWEKGRVSVDSFHAALAFDAKCKEVCPDE